MNCFRVVYLSDPIIWKDINEKELKEKFKNDIHDYVVAYAPEETNDWIVIYGDNLLLGSESVTNKMVTCKRTSKEE